MNNHDATEIAYKNGYEKGYADGKDEIAREIFQEIENLIYLDEAGRIADISAAFGELKFRYTGE